MVSVLSGNPRIEVVATARTGAECIRKAALTRPHVVIMDLKFKDLVAAEVIEELAARELKVAVYVIGPEVTKINPLLKQALKAGAFDFLRCRPTESDLAKLERQIANTIFVAGLTASNQIPCKEGARSSPDLKGLFGGKSLVTLVWAAERVTELSEAVARIKVGTRADLLLVVGVPPDNFEKIMGDLGDIVGHQARPISNGAELTGGRLYVTPRRVQDVVVEKGPGGSRMLSFVERRVQKEIGPNLDRLFTSIASTYKGQGAIVMVGGDGVEGVKGMKDVGDAGGVVLVDDLAVELTSALKQKYSDGSIPTRVAPLEDLRILLKELE